MLLAEPTINHQSPVRAVLWNGIGRLLRQVMQFVVSIVLARLLMPQDFGLVAMVTVFTGFVHNYVDLGVGAALIQRKDLRVDHLHTGFWVNISAGGIISLVMILFSYPIAVLYQEPRLQLLIVASALQFPLSGLSVVHTALLSRNMRFRELNIIEIVSAAVSGFVSIVCALVGFGVWSLIAGSLSYPFMRAVSSYFYVRWLPQFVFRKQALIEIFQYSAPLVGADTLNYWVRNADNFLIGRYCGASDLGFYSRAYALMMLPISQITYAIGAVMFPFLSREQHDVTRVKHILLKSHRLMMLIALPLMIGLCILAETFVRSVFGEKWLPTVPLVQTLSMLGAFQVIGASVGWVPNSMGRTDVSFRMSVVSAVVSLTCFVAGLPYGALGVAIAYSIGYYLVTFPIGWLMAGKLIGLSLSQIVVNLRGMATPALLMALTIWTLDKVLLVDTAASVRLICTAVLGAGVYAIGLKFFAPQLFTEALTIIREIPRGESVRTGSS